MGKVADNEIKASNSGRNFMGSLPWTALIQMVNDAGEASRGRRERYDPATGEFFDKKSVQRGYEAATIFAPHKIMGDPNVSGKDKFIQAGSMMLGLGFLPNLTGAGKRYADTKEQKQKEQTQKAHDLFDNAPKYEIPQEAKDIINSTTSGANKAREFASEAVDVSKKMTESNVPGYGIIKGNILSSGANVANEAVKSGGVESVGDVAKIHQSTTESLQKLSLANMAYRAEKSGELRNALGQSSQTEVGASNLETSGLRNMIDQKEQAFQINWVDPKYNKLQYDLMQLGNQMASGQGGGILSGII